MGLARTQCSISVKDKVNAVDQQYSAVFSEVERQDKRASRARFLLKELIDLFFEKTTPHNI